MKFQNKKLKKNQKNHKQQLFNYNVWFLFMTWPHSLHERMNSIFGNKHETHLSYIFMSIPFLQKRMLFIPWYGRSHFRLSWNFFFLFFLFFEHRATCISVYSYVLLLFGSIHFIFFISFFFFLRIHVLGIIEIFSYRKPQVQPMNLNMAVKTTEFDVCWI